MCITRKKKEVYGSIFVLVVLFIFLYIPNTFAEQYKEKNEISSKNDDYKSEPRIQMTLKKIIHLDWDKTIIEVSKMFPDGKLISGNEKERMLSAYFVYIKLTDINTIANLSFHQNEEYVKDQSQENSSLRIITIDTPTTEIQDKMYAEVCKVIKSVHDTVFTSISPSPADASFSIPDFNKKGDLNINVKKEKLLKKSIKININISRTPSTPIYADYSYWKDRYRDALDIFTISSGIGIGAKARMCVITPGLFVNQDYIGLRSGSFISKWKKYDPKKPEAIPIANDIAAPIPWRYIFFSGYEEFRSHWSYRRNKNIKTLHVIFISIIDKPYNENNYSYLTQLEAAIGMGVSLRLGFNPGELIDFLIGWTTLDIYDDDYYSKKIIKFI